MTTQRRHEQGQSMAVFVIFLTVLLGFAAIAVDAGRFFTERRFLQNAADAAALAAATALTQGRSSSEAEQLARDTIARNFASDPAGSSPSMPSAVPIYAVGHTGDGSFLLEGILINGTDVRVALRNQVDYTLGRAVGLVRQEISARAHAGTTADLMPIAVRQFIKLPGPNIGATAPCSGGKRDFLSVFSTTETSCLGSSTDATGQEEPSDGAAFSASDPGGDTTHHGPIVEILGNGSDPDNAADFRGFIALDIRDFGTTSSQDYYNGVTAGTSPNTIKDVETNWILAGGYPGPAFVAVTTPPDPMDQVALLDGNSSGKGVSAMDNRFKPGDEVLIAVYPGYTMAIPDFSIATPPQINLPTTGTVLSAGSFKVARNQAFSGMLTLTTLADALDPANPLVLGTLLDDGSPIDYDPNPVAPALGQGQSVVMRNITTAGASPGIYALWVQAQAGQPYLTSKVEPISVVVGSVTRDFRVSADASGKVAVNVGDIVSFTLTIENSPNNTSFDGTAALSLDAPLPPGTGPVTFSSTSVAPTKAGTTVLLTINTGSLLQGQYRFIVRATGHSDDSPTVPVTHLLPLTVNVAPSGAPGSDSYVDLSGFGVMRITSITSNSVSAYAITPVIADPNDARLRRGHESRLEPW